MNVKFIKGRRGIEQADIDPVRPEQVTNDYEVVSDIKLSELKAKNVDWISIGKSYSGCRSYVDGNGADYQKVDGKELTDGILATKALSTDWHAFHHSITDAQGKMSVTVDLGEIRNDLTHFYAHFDNRMIAGIGSPAGIVISVSNDGNNFRELARPKLILDSTNACIKYETEPITARYVKMSCGGMGGAFVFCSEFLIGVKNGNYVDESTPEESSKPEESKPDESKPNESKPDESKDGDDASDVDESTDNSSTPDESKNDSDAIGSDNSQAISSDSEDKNGSEITPDASQPADGEDNGNELGTLIWVIIGFAIVLAITVAEIIIVKKKKKNN